MNEYICFCFKLFEVCVLNTECKVLDSLRTYEVLPQSLLDVFMAIHDQMSVPIPLAYVKTQSKVDVLQTHFSL